MNHWTLDELEAIAANPKRKHVVMLVEEVRRLTAIALVANQLQQGTYVGSTEEILEQSLMRKLAAPRTPIRDQ